MNWKEFFRPTRGKVVLAIALSLIGAYASNLALLKIYPIDVFCAELPCPSFIPPYGEVYIALAAVTFLPALLFDIAYPAYSGLASLLGVVWAYVLASAIVWFIEGRKPKGRKR